MSDNSNVKLFLIYLGLFLLIVYNLCLASFSVYRGEVNFFNDVSRDFLLLQELHQKKIVFIGPRSNTNGLFHGPLWTYLNYPAWLLGHGNPVVVAWFWIGLTILFLVTSFLIAKKLFGTFPGLVYALLLSVKLIPHVNGIFHAEATIFVMPAFFFSMYEYVKTRKNWYLVFHFVIACALTQLNIGVGVQFLMISTALALGVIIRYKLWLHLLSFFVIPVCLINFILFDIKHHFQMLHALLGTGGSGKFFVTIPFWIQNRVNNLYSLLLVENTDPYQVFLFLIFCLVVIFSIIQMRENKKERALYSLFFLYYLCYFALSYFNKGVLLFHYTYLLIPLTLLWTVSFLRGRTKPIFILILALIYVINFQFAYSWVQTLQGNFIGKNENSWIGLSAVAKSVLAKQHGKPFGYFVFSPDSFAYQPRAAMLYNFGAGGSYASEYTKEQDTYIIAAPAPTNDPYMDYKWWVRVPVGITKKPDYIEKFPNGYTVLKYTLTSTEQKVPWDQSINLGIHFR